MVNHKLLTLDEEEVIEEASEAALALTG